MQPHFSSQTPSSLKVQSFFPFQVLLPQKPENPNLNYLNITKTKPSALPQEDSFNSHLSGCFLSKSIEDCKPNSIDQVFFQLQESVLDNQSNQHDCFSQNTSPKRSEETVYVVANNQSSEIKGWSKEERILLKKLAIQFKFDWKMIAKKFGNKTYTPHFLKMKYKKYIINEGVPKRIDFSHEEDVLIAKYFNDYGGDWEMANHFPNRTSNVLKDRFYSHIRKNSQLEALLKEKNHVEQNMSQLEGIPDIPVTWSETENDSQSQIEFLTDDTREETEASKRKEVERLKAQIRSLKSLHAVTCRELNKLNKVKASQ